MKIIAIVEEVWQGHRPMTVKEFTRALLTLGHQVIVLCPKPQEVEAWIQVHCRSLPGQVHLIEFRKPPSRRSPVKEEEQQLNVLQLWQAAKEAVDDAAQKLGKRPDVVFFDVLDGYLATGVTPACVDRIFPYPWTGVYYHPLHLRLNRPFWSGVPAVDQPHAALNAIRCLGVGTGDDGIVNILQSQLPGKRVVIYPDIIDVSEPNVSCPLVEHIKEKARGRRIIGCLGSQSKRKGILTLAQVAQQMASEPYFFVFAGPLYPKTYSPQEHTKLIEILGLNLENCFFYWDFVPTTEMFNGVAATCDILFAAYEQHPHCSGTINRAATFAKPVIVSKNYWMGDKVKEFNLGVTINEGNVSECIEAIRHLSNHPLENPNFEGYQKAHSVSNLPAAFQKLLGA